MNNLGYVLRGYDIYFGNPSSVKKGTPDPGFKDPIFKADYKQSRTSEDGRYLVPKGMSMLSCENTCSMNFNSEKIAGTHSFFLSKLTLTSLMIELVGIVA